MSTDPRATYLVTATAIPLTSDANPNVAYYTGNSAAWGQHGSAAVSPNSSISSPTNTSSSVYQTSPPTPSLAGSDYGYGNSPPSSAASTPASLSAPVNDSGDDQPFIVTPEFEATVNARYNEAVLSGAMQASMTPAIHSAVPLALSSPPYTQNIPAPVRQEQYYPTLSPAQPQHHTMSPQDAGYAAYPIAGHPSGHLSAGPGAQVNASWPQYDYAGNGYMAPVSGYAAPQEQWYPA